MRAHRAWATRCLVYGFAVSIAVAAVGEARAQVDPNLQSRINTFSPPITSIEIAPQSAPERYAVGAPLFAVKTATGPDCAAPMTKAESISYLANNKEFSEQSRNRAKALPVAQDKASLDAYVRRDAAYCIDSTDIAVCTKGIIVPITNWTCPKQPTTLKFSVASNPTYETNVLKSNQNIHPDTSLALNGTGLFTTAGLRGYDIIAFSAAASSARYSDFPSKSVDNFSTQGLYQFFLDAYIAGKRSIDADNPAKSEDNTNRVTYDVLAVGYVNQTAFTPTFHKETADLFTPQATLARQNIGLLGPSDIGCTPIFNGDPKKPGYCYYANISITAGQTFSDVPTLQNANLALSGTVNKRFDQTDWVLSVAGTVTAKNFENVPGGRRDLQLQLGPQVSYTPSKCVSFSLSATYYRNYSTLATAAWNGFIIQPTLTVNFGVIPPPEAPHTICG